VTYLTQEQFCERYGVPMRTALRWRNKGQGPAYVRMGPRRIAYRLSDCESWLAERTYHQTSDEALPKRRPKSMSVVK
jgi:predicted DNA-binding transcriptional regulator AlpA